MVVRRIFFEMVDTIREGMNFGSGGKEVVQVVTICVSGHLFERLGLARMPRNSGNESRSRAIYPIVIEIPDDSTITPAPSKVGSNALE